MIGFEITNSPQTCAMGDDHALVADLAGRNPAALDHVLNSHRLVVDRGHHQTANIANTAKFLASEHPGCPQRGPAINGLHLILLFVGPRRLEFAPDDGLANSFRLLLGQVVIFDEFFQDLIFEAEDFIDRIQAAAEQAHAADRHGDLALVQIVPTDIGVAIGERALKLSQADAFQPQSIRVGLDLIAADRAAKAGHVGNARDRAKFAFQHPILQRFDVIQSVDVSSGTVLGNLQDVAINLACGRFGGYLRTDAGRQGLADGGHAVDDLLPGRLVGPLTAVVPIHLEVA